LYFSGKLVDTLSSIDVKLFDVITSETGRWSKKPGHVFTKLHHQDQAQDSE